MASKATPCLSNPCQNVLFRAVKAVSRPLKVLCQSRARLLKLCNALESIPFGYAWSILSDMFCELISEWQNSQSWQKCCFVCSGFSCATYFDQILAHSHLKPDWDTTILWVWCNLLMKQKHYLTYCFVCYYFFILCGVEIVQCNLWVEQNILHWM